MRFNFRALAAIGLFTQCMELAACSVPTRSPASQLLTVCEMKYSSKDSEPFSFEAKYTSDGMHSYFMGNCRGLSTIQIARAPTDSDGSFEAFGAARRKECESRKILLPCNIDADVTGSGRVVMTAEGVALEVISISGYTFVE